MWKIVKGKRPSKVDETVYEYKYLKRDDGLTLSLERSGRDGQEVFLLEGSFGKCYFFALRWDPENNKALDKYIVYTNIRGKEWVLDQKTNEALIIQYASDIKSGLMKFSSFFYPDSIPIKDVLFDTSRFNENAHIVPLEDLK